MAAIANRFYDGSEPSITSLGEEPIVAIVSSSPCHCGKCAESSRHALFGMNGFAVHREFVAKSIAATSRHERARPCCFGMYVSYHSCLFSYLAILFSC